MRGTLPKGLALALALGVALAGCAQTGGNKQTGGAVVGGIAGGLLGSLVGGGTGRVVAIIGGTLLGALAGSEIGKHLDGHDQQAIAHTTQHALEKSPDGEVNTWRNPNTGHRGSVVAKNVFKNAKGEVCREFTQTIRMGDRTEEAYGTACRRPDGTWRIVPPDASL